MHREISIAVAVKCDMSPILHSLPEMSTERVEELTALRFIECGKRISVNAPRAKIMSGQSAMSYKQLFLLILTIWSAELFTRFLFDAMIPPQMEYRTVYMEKDAKKNLFVGSSLGDFGRRGWKIVSVNGDPDNKQQFIVFMQRQTMLRLDR